MLLLYVNVIYTLIKHYYNLNEYMYLYNNVNQ